MSHDHPDRGPRCATCDVEEKSCLTGSKKGSKACPTLTDQAGVKRVNEVYERPDVRRFAQAASIQEAECYANRTGEDYILQPTKPRVVEICEFARRMGYTRLGLAFCAGLAREAELAARVFADWGFELNSVICKAGCIPKKDLGLSADQTIRLSEEEEMCNPVYQADALNRAESEFNVLLGLCVGHDALFFQHAQAPTTVLAVKDRVTGHNPLAPLYQINSYYRKVREPDLC